MKVAVVILNYNGGRFINACLESVFKLNTKNIDLEAIVVDNNSSDDSINKIKKFKGITLIENQENQGYVEGNNIGIKEALKNGNDEVLILNPDTIVDKDIIVELVKVFDSDKKVGIVGPKIYFAPGFEFYKDRYKDGERGKVIWFAGGLLDWPNVLASHRGVDEVDKGQYEQTTETEFVSGCAMMVKREVFEKIGLFDRKYFMYYEDNDFCQRAKRAGFEILYQPKGKLWHLNAGSSSSGSDLQEYFITRNRLLFGLRYASSRAKFALVRQGVSFIFTGRKWQKIGARDFFLGKFGKGSWTS